MSSVSVIRQAIRIYQVAQIELEKGNSLGFYDKSGNRVIKKSFGCDLID